mgnify:FL=1
MTSSIVIPVFNGEEFLKANLPAVISLAADEIIIVNDASTDGSAEFIAQSFPQIKLIRHSRNCRFPISVNDGFSHATGDIIFLLNQDVNPQPDLIKKTLPHFADPKVFAVTFSEQNRAWAKGEFKNGFLEFTNGPRDNKIHESLWASGGSAAFRKDLWDKFGGFDPIFTPGYFEDLDLGWQARRAGYKIIWDPKCSVQHLAETAFNKAFSPQKLRYIKERNYLLAHWKNLTGKQLREHTHFLFLRILRHPGFIIPTLWALWKKLVS